jgi:hypothetical protein
MNTVKHNPIALNLPRIVGLLILYGRHVVQEMTNNAWFPSPSPTLASVTSKLDALEAAELTARTRAKGTAAARNLERKAVEDELTALKGYAQWVAGQNPDKADIIIESAGMSSKRVTPRQKPELSVARGGAPGEVVLRARSLRRPAAYDWQHSGDGGQTWTAAGTTTVASRTLSGFSAGTTYLFRYRTTVATTTGAWSQTVSFAVH